MSSVLKNIVRFVNIPAGAAVVQPHGLSLDGVGIIPDHIQQSTSGDFTINADATSVTATNNGVASASIDVLAERWHTIPRALPPPLGNLTPQPFVTAQGGISGPLAGTNRISGTYTVGAGGVAVRDAVYESASDTADKADGNDAGKVPVIGLVESVNGLNCEVIYFGELGGFAGLTPNATVFLSDVPGQITEIPLNEIGAISQKIGFVKNSTTIVVMLDRDFTEL